MSAVGSSANRPQTPVHSGQLSSRKKKKKSIGCKSIVQTYRRTPCQKLCRLGTMSGEKVRFRISTTPKVVAFWPGEKTWNIKVGEVTFGHEIQCWRFCTGGQMTFQGVDSPVNVKAIRPHGRRVGTRCFSGRDEIAAPEMHSLTQRACVRWPIHLSGLSVGGLLKEAALQSWTSAGLAAAEMSNGTRTYECGTINALAYKQHESRRI